MKHEDNNKTHNKQIEPNFFPLETSKTFVANKEKLLEQSKQSNNLFKIMTANEWIELAKTRPIPKMLFDEFWFETELCILFADANLGKSILAVQIGNSISKGKVIPGFCLGAQQQKVLYFDFELSEKQFEKRHSIDFNQHYDFDDNFLRIVINPDSEIPEHGTFEDYLNRSLEKSIIGTGAKILIIDNLTYMKNETEKAKSALPLMKHLKAVKSKYGLSILALAHTPKRDSSKPITRNDLQGSKMLINFCDSSFAVGESHTEKNVRYLKQIKARNTEIKYDKDNVIVCQKAKPDNFLKFEFIGFGNEHEFLKQISDQDKKILEENIIELYKSKPEMSYGQIAKELGTNKMKVKRTLDKHN